MTILDGKKTSNDIKDEIAHEVNSIISNGDRPPHLAAVIVGNDGASPVSYTHLRAHET